MYSSLTSNKLLRYKSVVEAWLCIPLEALQRVTISNLVINICSYSSGCVSSFFLTLLCNILYVIANTDLIYIYISLNNINLIKS